ncbi:hypothetical protein ACLMJK_005251 [Lecanora helva]
MFSQSAFMAANLRSTQNSRSRYKGIRRTSKVAGQITPITLQSAFGAASLSGTGETHSPTYHLSVAKAWSEWQKRPDRASHQPACIADALSSDLLSESAELPADQPVIYQENLHTRRGSKIDAWKRSLADKASSVPAWNRMQKRAKSVGYVATLRHRELGMALIRNGSVSLPQIIVTPPTPTSTSFENPFSFDHIFLAPPPSCYRRKDRRRQAEMEYERRLLVKNRNCSAQQNLSRWTYEQAGTVQLDPTGTETSNTTDSRYEMIHGADDQPISNHEGKIMVEVEQSHTPDSRLEMTQGSGEQPNVDYEEKIIVPDPNEDLLDKEMALRNLSLPETLPAESPDMWGQRLGSQSENSNAFYKKPAKIFKVRDFVDCRLEAAQFETHLMSKLQRLGF